MNKPTRPQSFPSPVQRLADARHKRTPQAPAPYRPQPVPRCLQPKAATPTPPDAKAVNAAHQGPRPSPSASQAKTVSPIQRHVGPPTRPCAAPVAPAVYRPQPAPKVLQTKAAAVGHARRGDWTPTARASAVVQRANVVTGARPGFGPAATRNVVAPLRAGGIVQMAYDPSWTAPSAGAYSINPSAVPNMIRPFHWGEVSGASSRAGSSGVSEGEVGSYALVQHLEQVGDMLTGDHQPSGASVKEALREALHKAKVGPLTREQARNAYKKAITIVVTDAWHKGYSRTYGGRNSKAQIEEDAKDLFGAAVKDFTLLAEEFERQGWDSDDIEDCWKALDDARKAFFATGDIQAGTMG